MGIDNRDSNKGEGNIDFAQGSKPWLFKNEGRILAKIAAIRGEETKKFNKYNEDAVSHYNKLTPELRTQFGHGDQPPVPLESKMTDEQLREQAIVEICRDEDREAYVASGEPMRLADQSVQESSLTKNLSDEDQKPIIEKVAALLSKRPLSDPGHPMTKGGDSYRYDRIMESYNYLIGQAIKELKTETS